MIGVGGGLWTPTILRPLSAPPVDPPAEAVIPASALAAYGGLSDAANYTLDGSSKVSQWDDLSGNENHATQPTASFRPIVSNDVGGVPGLLVAGRSPDFEHLLLDDAAIPRNTNVHVGMAWREDADQQGLIVGDTNQSQRPFRWWEDAGGSGNTVEQPTRATVSEIHVNSIMDTPFTSTTTSGQLGTAVHADDTAIMLVKDLNLNTLTSGYTWQDLAIAAVSDSSGTIAQYNLAGRIYGFVTFTDWADAADALAWLEAQIQVNSAPSATSPDLGFDVGAPS